jgi:hypothetical protein
MNIGAVIELDFGDVADPTERFELIRKNVADRLHEIPVLTQRDHSSSLRPHVAGAGPGRSIRPRSTHHAVRSAVARNRRPVRRADLGVSLATTGSHATAVAALDHRRSRRWKRVAAALKVHHALADGVSGSRNLRQSLRHFARGTRTGPQSRTTRQANRSRRIRCRSCSRGLRRLRAEPALAVSVVTSWLTPSIRRRTHGRARGAVARSKANDARPTLDLRGAPYVVQRARRGGEGVSPYARSPRRREARGEVSRGLGD